MSGQADKQYGKHIVATVDANLAKGHFKALYHNSNYSTYVLGIKAI